MTLKYFMWGFQTHFQGLAESNAERVLQRLDKRFKPRVFLVGFLMQERNDRLAVCVAPDDCPFQPTLFATTLQRAALIEKADPANNSFHMHPRAHEMHLERIKLRAIMRAVKEAVDGHTESDGWKSYCGTPTLVEGYLVVAVLQVQRHVYESCYHLNKRTRLDFAVGIGLVETTIQELLTAYFERLRQPQPGEDLMGLEADQLIRVAARNVMNTAAWATGTTDGLHALYTACEAVSILHYEGSAGIGTVVIGAMDHPNVRMELELTSPVSIRDYGAVRKLLQLASSKLSLICDSASVLGLGHIRDNYDPSREDLFVVRFRTQFVWELLHAGQTMIHVAFGVPCLKCPGFDRERFERDVPRLMPKVEGASLRRLVDLAECVASQPHGTMLVISHDAIKEAERLHNQGSCVKPFSLTEDNVPWVTAIDGAVLCDPDGNCHAIGVILDGMASPRCTPTRGARYNSAVRYVYSVNNCIAVVKSEDGTVNVLPDLRPQLRKCDLEERLNEFSEVVAADVVEWKAFHALMKWFQEHKFYLTAEACEQVNRLRPVAEAKLEAADPGRMMIVYSDCKPHPDMNESYFT
jgi:hypothetical protein